MSPDESFLAELLRALDDSRLEAIVVGTTAAVLQGAPVMTQDIDLLIRDTPRNREKVADLCKHLGNAQAMAVSELTSALTVVGAAVPVDLLFDTLPGGLTFESIKSRAVRIRVGDALATAAALADVIRSKEAAGRPKDLAQLPILRETLRVRAALGPGGDG